MPFFFGQRRNQLDHFFDGCPQIEGSDGKLQLAGLDFGNIQHIVDQGQQMAGAVLNHGHLLVLLLVQRPGQPLEHDAGKADDGVERRAQFMGHGGQKGGFDPVGRLGLFHGRGQFRRPLDDALSPFPD